MHSPVHRAMLGKPTYFVVYVSCIVTGKVKSGLTVRESSSSGYPAPPLVAWL